MAEKTTITAVLVEDTMSVIEVCQICQISEETLNDMFEHGLFNHQEYKLQQVQFNQTMVNRIQTACRLQRDLGINYPGIAVILQMLEEMDELRTQLNILRRHFER